MALQTIAPMPWPFTLAGIHPGNINDYFTLDNTGDRWATVFEMPATGTLTDVLFATSAVTTGDTVDVLLCTLESTGLPSATDTLKYTNGSGTVTIADSDDYVYKVAPINGGTGVSVTYKDACAVVIKEQNSSKTIRISYSWYSSFITTPGYPYICTKDSAGSYSKLTNVGAVGVKISGVWYPVGNIFSILTASSLTFSSNNDEKAVRIYLPFKCRITGAYVAATIASGSLCMKLYDATTSPTLLATSDTIDSTEIRSTAAALNLQLLFDTPIEVPANTVRVLSVQRISSSPTINAFKYDSTYSGFMPHGAYGSLWTRSGGSGNFSETTTTSPWMGVIIDQLDDGAGAAGGGGPIFGGMIVR